MTTLDPRALEAAAQVRYPYTETMWKHESQCGRDMYLDSERETITAYLAVAQPVVETVAELVELPAGTVIRCHSGTILESFEAWEADLIWCPTEDDGARKSREVPLPARVIWRPHD